MVAGTVGIGLLSSARFAFRLGAVEVAVPLSCYLCEDCGEVHLRATDLSKVRAARAAGAASTKFRTVPSASGARRAMDTYRLLGSLAKKKGDKS